MGICWISEPSVPASSAPRPTHSAQFHSNANTSLRIPTVACRIQPSRVQPGGVKCPVSATTVVLIRSATSNAGVPDDLDQVYPRISVESHCWILIAPWFPRSEPCMRCALSSKTTALRFRGTLLADGRWHCGAIPVGRTHAPGDTEGSTAGAYTTIQIQARQQCAYTLVILL